MRLRNLTFIAIGLTAALTTPAFAGVNLITNGSFEYSSGTTPEAPCQVGYNCSGTGSSIAGWTMDPSSTYPEAGTPPTPTDFSWLPGYTFVMDSTNSVTCNAGALSMWVSPGPESGSNFLAQDAYYHPDAIQQTVDLVNGQTYDLNFYWATAQQSGFSGDTFDQWQVSLGGTVLTTTGLTEKSEPFGHGVGGLQLRLRLDRSHGPDGNFVPGHVQWEHVNGRRLQRIGGRQQWPSVLAPGQRVLDHRPGTVDLGDASHRLCRPSLCGLPRPRPGADLDLLNASAQEAETQAALLRAAWLC